MGWQTVVLLNSIIALCYAGIVLAIVRGLVSTRQLTSNPLALATAAIFFSCAVHHGEHAVHLAGLGGHHEVLAAGRELFGGWHSIVVDGFGAVAAVTYLAMRRSYSALMHTPAMFDDAVRAAAEDRLREAAYTDLVTGLPNRAAFELRAIEMGAQAEVSVVFMDLDGFKAVNDRHGHQVGDRLLRELGARVQRELRDGERLYRFGGDEFVLLAEEHGPEQLDELVCRVEALLTAPVQSREGALTVGVSTGTATGPPGPGLDTLLRLADQRMYDQKRRRSVLRPGPATA
jgi:diguanylate cyclase (GGDEF)-like protein